MNKAALYRRANQLTRCDSLKIMQEFASILKSTSNGRVSLLDVGCGPGDVTAEIILPILPPDFERLVGIDISDEMLEYARKTQTHPKLSFQQFNIDVELEKQSLNGTEFDHITSFFCLMWVRNQRLCVENFYKLLKPGGDILVVFIVNTAVYDAYRHQSEDDRWSQYTNDYDRIVSPYYNSPNPRDEFNNLLKICGFTECSVRMEEKTFNCDVDEMRGNQTRTLPLNFLLKHFKFLLRFIIFR